MPQGFYSARKEVQWDSGQEGCLLDGVFITLVCVFFFFFLFFLARTPQLTLTAWG